MTVRSSALGDVLHANGPAANRAGNMDLYGWLVGSWDIDVTEFQEDGSKRSSSRSTVRPHSSRGLLTPERLPRW